MPCPWWRLRISPVDHAKHDNQSTYIVHLLGGHSHINVIYQNIKRSSNTMEFSSYATYGRPWWDPFPPLPTPGQYPVSTKKQKTYKETHPSPLYCSAYVCPSVLWKSSKSTERGERGTHNQRSLNLSVLLPKHTSSSELIRFPFHIHTGCISFGWQSQAFDV